MANKFKPTPPTTSGWYQVQWGDDGDYKINTVEVIEGQTDDGNAWLCWVLNDADAVMIDPDDTQSRWRRVDPPKS